MPTKRRKAEEIVAKLRQVNVLSGQGTVVPYVVRQIGVTEVTSSGWRNEDGGSCVPLRAERSNHVWSYDFIEDRPSSIVKWPRR